MRGSFVSVNERGCGRPDTTKRREREAIRKLHKCMWRMRETIYTGCEENKLKNEAEKIF